MRDLRKIIQSLLLKLYEPDQVDQLLAQIWSQIEGFKRENSQIQNIHPSVAQLSAKDMVLIVYGDQFSGAGPPLKSLASFLNLNIGDVINRVHLLPFCPYSSDDGYSVIDYRQVTPDMGSWKDIASSGRKLPSDVRPST